MGWTAERVNADDVHVYPLDDLIAHHLVPDCVCGPSCEMVTRADGADGWLYTHHSLARSEYHEHE